jgi:hypothetical protein
MNSAGHSSPSTSTPSTPRPIPRRRRWNHHRRTRRRRTTPDCRRRRPTHDPPSGSHPKPLLHRHHPRQARHHLARGFRRHIHAVHRPHHRHARPRARRRRAAPDQPPRPLQVLPRHRRVPYPQMLMSRGRRPRDLRPIRIPDRQPRWTDQLAPRRAHRLTTRALHRHAPRRVPARDQHNAKPDHNRSHRPAHDPPPPPPRTRPLLKRPRIPRIKPAPTLRAHTRHHALERVVAPFAVCSSLPRAHAGSLTVVASHELPQSCGPRSHAPAPGSHGLPQSTTTPCPKMTCAPPFHPWAKPPFRHSIP